MNTIYYIDIFSDTIMPFFPLGVCLYKFKVHHSSILCFLCIYLSLTVILFGTSNYLADRKINNLWIYNIFPVVEVLLVTAILTSSVRIKLNQFPTFLCVIMILTFGYKFFTTELFVKYSASLGLMADLIIAILSISCLHKILHDQLLNEFNDKLIYRMSMTLLLYATGSFIVQAVYALNSGREKTFTAKIWLVNDVLLIIKYFMMTKFLLEIADEKKIT